MKINEAFKSIRKKIVIFKFTLSRGYAWCQTPTLVLVAAGIIKPYFPMLRLYELCIIGFTAIMIAGIIDKKFGFLTEEQNYSTRTNTLLMSGLRGEMK